MGSSSMDASHVCTLVYVLFGIRKHHQSKLQIMPTASASEVFVLIDGRKKHHQHKLQRVKTVLDTSRSGVQEPNADSTRARSG